MHNEPVLVGLSGGIDSSVALFLLKNLGHPVFGVSLIFTPGRYNRCCAEESIRWAERLCAQLGVPFFSLPVGEEFEKQIIRPFIEEYARARTPNPCILCNPLIKWRYLLMWADKLGVPKIATGHYARVVEVNGEYQLFRAKDREKDQSYFLARLSSVALARTIFPLGDYTKEEVREIAKKLPLTPDRPESQEVCFVPDDDLAGFLRSRGLAVSSGPTYDIHGNLLGYHPPAVFTIGQRHYLGVATGKPMYVVKIIPGTNAIVIDSSAYSGSLLADNISWVNDVPKLPARFKARIRYRHTPADCYVSFDSGFLRVDFDTPQWAITPGQYVTIYDDDRVLGCARIIEKL